MRHQELLDLWQSASGHYPTKAGWKEPTTSAEAAARIEAKGRAAKLRHAVRGAFELGWEGTADELASRLGESVLSIRPRVSELHRQGVIERSGTRHTNSSGASAHCWRLTIATRRAG